VIASGTEDTGLCSFTWQEHRVYTCDSSGTVYDPSETFLVSDESPACTVAAGSWTVIKFYTGAECGPQEESRSMDIVSVVVVLILCVCFGLGFIAGQQR